MNTFKIEKRTGTYAELLETYGFANLLSKVFDSINVSDADIIISDKEVYYEVSTNAPVSDEMIEKLSYFPLFRYVKQKTDSEVSQLPDYFDYPVQKEWKRERQALLNQAYKEYQGKDKKSERERRVNEIERIFENEKRIDFTLDVYAQIITPNNFPSFEKLYQNLFNNKEFFTQFINEIIHTYGKDSYVNKESEKKIKSLSFSKSVTATQLYNPNQGQGLNKPKADGLNRKNFDSSWISESLKISGALSDMICQLVKVGSSYDLKVFVPEYRQINYHFKSILIPKFKKYLKGNTPIEIDILNILLLTQMIIEHSGFMGRRKKVKDIVAGLHSVYQKDLGQNKAVVNIGFIQVPDFIKTGSKEENQTWIDILEEQRQIIGSIKESGDTVQGLLLYRNFISGSDINSFFRFSYWYAIYLSTRVSNKKYARSFSIETLNQFYKCMDTNELKLSEIISNIGFKAVAGAIRKSTVSLQYTPKENRKYDVRYGIAQTLQNKSKSKEDLAEFTGEFIALYNSETARQAEKTGSSLRASVRENELIEFYTLLDKFPSKLVGALLASYGFALPAKETTKSNEQEQDTTEEIVEE
ncbi:MULTISPECIES: hypothetical protein [Proteiniphilum]|uniref:hypothetical protein n=1 Tax=Proteiniphilum TaxID=294702 RepID=UPI0003750807|nr:MULTISPECIES: hypothetical protein [Proteiniphilum]